MILDNFKINTDSTTDILKFHINPPPKKKTPTLKTKTD
jgi:hypothetical protein